MKILQLFFINEGTQPTQDMPDKEREKNKRNYTLYNWKFATERKRKKNFSQRKGKKRWGETDKRISGRENEKKEWEKSGKL